jgi:hypothetical protein
MSANAIRAHFYFQGDTMETTLEPSPFKAEVDRAAAAATRLETLLQELTKSLAHAKTENAALRAQIDTDGKRLRVLIADVEALTSAEPKTLIARLEKLLGVERDAKSGRR